MLQRTKTKLQFRVKRIYTSLSALFGQRQEHGVQLDDNPGSILVNVPPRIMITGNSSQAAGSGQNRRNHGKDALNADVQRTTTIIYSGNTPNIAGQNYEGLDVNATTGSTGFFSNGQNFVVTHSRMVNNSTQINNQVAVGDKEVKAKELLSKRMIQGAAHDSSARDPPPRCHPGTRISINERIMVWFYNEKKQELILWIYGPAGVGKSAIVQTISDTLAAAKCLGASVFFSRPNGRNNSRCVFITIAYQLAVRIPAYCAFISERLASDPELVNKGMKEQFKTFIIEPFAEKKIGADGKSWGILLDGLDELDQRPWQREIIHLVTNFAREHPDAPLIWVIASRPEPHILATFLKAKQMASNYRKEYIPVNSPEACQDVERYLRSSFETIREESLFIVPHDWPEEMKVTRLAHAASGLFAFADVAVRFIGDAEHADPGTRLNDVLAVIERSGGDSGEEKPFAHLDALYTRILASIPRKTWPVTQQVLVAISQLPFPALSCAKMLSLILGIDLGRIYTAINDLYSILDISLDNAYSQLRFHHTSFADFLRDPTRSIELYAPFEKIWEDIEECGVRVWLDFKRQSPRGLKYHDRWHKYISQLHSDVNALDKMSMGLSVYLTGWIHMAISSSLCRKRDFALKETSPEHWDQVVEMLCQVEPDTLSMGSPGIYKVASAWFDVWKICHKDLSDKGIVHEIRLEQLQLGCLWWPENTIKHMVWVSKKNSNEDGAGWVLFWKRNRLDKYISGLEYFQQHHPTLPVLICGSRENRFAVFIYEYTEDDFTERPLHADIKEELDFEEYRYQGYYCIPYSGDV